MFKIIKDEIQFGTQKLELETGLLANQADGAVLVKYGKTSILCTVVSDKKDSTNVDFFPLTVNYVEKQYAGGVIPGGFFKREGRQSEREILISRLIDRPIRPMFADGYFRNTQIICTLLSYDRQYDPDILALIGASAACAVAGLPLKAVVSGVRVAYINGEYILNPSNEELKNPKNKLNLVVGGTETGVSMVESEASELSEAIMLGAIDFGQLENQKIAKFIKNFAKKTGDKKVTFVHRNFYKLFEKIEKNFTKKTTNAYNIANKLERKEEIDNILDLIKKDFLGDEKKCNDYLVFIGDSGVETNEVDIKLSYEKLQEKIVRGYILNNKKRLDGRALEEVRKIDAQINILPSVHGSALFTRGGTQSLGIITLGGSMDAQSNDSLTALDNSESFMLHYNFPPYSVGDLSPLRGPGRRELGHGKLAHRALSYIIPERSKFPYTIRLVSEIMAADGSTSMATVCSCCLAMIAANVPIKSMVAGVAMGLIKEGEEYVVLTDIMADEDHLGDMDFKVTGTENGITALQMDIKITGITHEIMQIALKDAKEGRLHIMKEMQKGLENDKDKVGLNAPNVENVKIKKTDIMSIIGKGGSTIKNITSESGTKVEILESEEVVTLIGSKESNNIAKKMINFVTGNIKNGEKFSGKITEILPFGVIVDIGNSISTMVHISEIANKRVEKIEDYVKIEEKVDIVCIGKDDKFRLKFSIAKAKLNDKEIIEKDARKEEKSPRINSNFDKGSKYDDKYSSSDRKYKSYNNNSKSKNKSNDYSKKEFKDHRPQRAKLPIEKPQSKIARLFRMIKK